jgi:hypothetical protein
VIDDWLCFASLIELSLITTKELTPEFNQECWW